MTTTSSRPFIAAMQVTLDGYILGPEGEADWVDSWADGLELLPPVDAFLLGGGMFPDYEQFWAAILDDPAAASAWLGRDPYPREVTYARIAAETEHLVLSTTLSHATWPTARFVRDINELRTLKGQAGNAVYVVGGPGLVRHVELDQVFVWAGRQPDAGVRRVRAGATRIAAFALRVAPPT
jgi:hypothetical protein